MFTVSTVQPYCRRITWVCGYYLCVKGQEDGWGVRWGVGMAGGVVGWWVCMKVCMVLNKNNCHFQANQTHFLFQIGNICSQAAVSMMHPSLKDMALQNMVMEKVGTTWHQSLQTEPAALSHAIAIVWLSALLFRNVHGFILLQLSVLQTVTVVD